MNFAGIAELIHKIKRGPTDVVGIDVASSAVRSVRIKATDGDLQLLGADLLDPVKTNNTGEENDAASPAPKTLHLPRKLKGRYASVALSGEQAVVKLLTFPGQFDGGSGEKVVQALGLEDASHYRIGYKIISQGHGRSEARVLAVAMPETEAAMVNDLLPSGLPAPFSLEVSGLATITSFLHGPALSHNAEAVGVLDFGARTTSFGLFNRNSLSLIRRFSIGSDSVINSVQKALGVDHDTAQGIMADGAFDISQSVSEVMDPLIKQLTVCRDFVERKEDCRVAKVYAIGGLAMSGDAIDEIGSALGIDVDSWNPLGYIESAPGAIPENIEGNEWQFAAAMGAALATLEES
jgi:Tfp pilus assembly PilM family ATPase